MDLVKIWGNLLASGGGPVCTIPTTYFMQGVQVFAYANDASSSSLESDETASAGPQVAAGTGNTDEDDDGDGDEDEDEDSRPSTSVCGGGGDDEDADTLTEAEAAPKKRRRRIQRIRYSREEYKCTMCTYTCTTEKAFLRHLRGCESVPCGATGADAEGIGGGSVGPRLSCPICGKDRNSEQSILVHMKKHRDDKHFCCDLCKFRTLQLKKLIQHRRMHTGEKPHLCPYCTYRSARRDNLRSHVRRVHKKENLTCDTFTPRSMLLVPTKPKPGAD